MRKILVAIILSFPLWAGSKITVKYDSISYVVNLDTMKLDKTGKVPVFEIVKGLGIPDSLKFRFIGDDGYHPEKDIPYKKLKYGLIDPETRNLKWKSGADLTKCYNVKRVKFIKAVK